MTDKNDGSKEIKANSVQSQGRPSNGPERSGPKSRSQDQVTGRSSQTPKTDQVAKSSPKPKSNPNGSSSVTRSPTNVSGIQHGQVINREAASQTLRSLLTNFTLRHFLPAVSVSKIMEAFGSTKWEALEPFLKNLRIETNYLKEKDSGNDKVKHLTIKKLGRMRVPILDEESKQKTDESGKLQWEGPESYAPGSAVTLKFALKSDGMISVKDYFKKCQSCTQSSN